MPTPVCVITGFLGSGKTTLIGRLLADPAYARTAVIVNEFGELALDHDLIATADETLLRLTTGCLCCAVRTDLVATLLDLAARRDAGEIGFDRVVIETSGLADPAPILHALMTDPALGERFVLGAVVVLVDVLLGAATLAAHPEAARQIAFADRIMLTKTDLAPVPDALRAAVARHNDLAPVSAGLPDAATMFAPTPPALPPPPVAQHTPGVVACPIRRTEPVPALAVTLLLEALAEQCGAKLLRVKGLFDLAEAPGRPAVVHAVQHVIAPVALLDAWPSADRSSRAVVIGVGLPPHFPARLFDAICAEVADETTRGDDLRRN
jgi:G3E family GTPase